MAAPGSLGLLHAPSFAVVKCQPVASRASARRAPRALFAVRASAADASNKDAVLRAFRENRALKIISGLQNFDRSSVASVVTAADKGGATHVDIACDEDLVKLAMDLTNLPICVSSVDPSAFHSAVEAGAKMVEIGNYDSFYEMGIEFSSEQILKLTRETRKMLPDITLSVTVPHTLSLPDQVDDVEIPYTLPFSFYNLKNLELSTDFTEMHTVLFMFTLLRSCPNLQSLEIELRDGVDQSFEADWEFLNALWTDGMCAKLQVVWIIDIAWLPNEISFMKLMLSKARLLRTLYVDGHPDYFDDSLTDLLKCKRASAQARVLFEGLVQQY